jgi:SMI1 / KNR4 family (SUKH-1)
VTLSGGGVSGFKPHSQSWYTELEWLSSNGSDLAFSGITGISLRQKPVRSLTRLGCGAEVVGAAAVVDCIGAARVLVSGDGVPARSVVAQPPNVRAASATAVVAQVKCGNMFTASVLSSAATAANLELNQSSSAGAQRYPPAVWREMALRVYPDAQFESGVDPRDLDAAASALGEALPPDLGSLLMETNGIIGPDGLDVVWRLARIVEDNRTFRTSSDLAELYLPFDGLLFFGDNGGGDQFAFVLRDNRRDIFVWDHETDSRYWVAGHLENFLSHALSAQDD